jgi:hypothetical protein
MPKKKELVFSAIGALKNTLKTMGVLGGCRGKSKSVKNVNVLNR